MRIVIVGAGAIGQWTAYEAALRGAAVVLASRSGKPLSLDVVGTLPPVRPATVDASDAEAMTRLVTGADVLVNAVNPPYTDWDEKWPPMAAGFLATAERSGAALLTIGNLYPYGHPTTPIVEGVTPEVPNGHKGRVRQAMWREAEARHRAGRIRAAELRAADYFGPAVTTGMSYLNQYAIRPAMAGRTAHHIMGVVDVPHAWTYVRDIGRLAAAVAMSEQADAWGRVWHVPTEAPRSLADVARDVAELADRQTRKPRPYPRLVKAALRVVPLIRELDEMAPAFEAPYTLDGSAAERRFGIAATPWHTALEQTVAWLRSRA